MAYSRTYSGIYHRKGYGTPCGRRGPVCEVHTHFISAPCMSARRPHHPWLRNAEARDAGVAQELREHADGGTQARSERAINLQLD